MAETNPQKVNEATSKNSTVSTFEGKIICKSNGRVLVVTNKDTDTDESQELSLRQHEDATSNTVSIPTTLTSTPTNERLQYLTIKTKSIAFQGQNGGDKSHATEQTFRLHTFDNVNDCTTKVGDNINVTESARENDKESLFSRLLASATQADLRECDVGSHRTKSVLMCFSCRLNFGLGSEFVSHATSKHETLLNNTEKQLLDCENICSVIQETPKNKAVIYFLEPTYTKPKDIQATNEDHDCQTNAPERHLEKRYSLSDLTEANNADNVTAIANDTDNTKEENTGDVESKIKSTDSEKQQNDMKMATVIDSESQQNLQIIEKRNTEELPKSNSDKTEEETSKEIPETSEEIKINEDSTFQEAKARSPKGATDKSDTPDGAIAKKQSQSTAMASETIASPSSLPSVNSVKAPKMRDTIFNGAGGVATVDPLFQMSIFQSRNSCKTLKCPRCNWHYKYRQTLDAHMKEKHSEDTSDCLYCNANQPHPRLSRGESYACGYKPFKCEVCNYSTTTKGNLSIHNQSDKHLFNLKTIQHQQQKDKINGQSATSRSQPSGSANNQVSGNAIPARSLAEKQEQIQNLLQQQQIQARKRSSPDAGTSKNNTQHLPSKRKNGGKEHPTSPLNAGSSQHKATWRCDLCNYETDYSRNLRIHTQSEKHAHNAALARASGSRRVEEIQNSLLDSGGESSGVEDQTETKENEPSASASAATDQNIPSNTMAALYYYLHSLQNSMQNNQEKELRLTPNIQEQEKQQKQFFAQQQQLILAQQYQQMLAQLAGSGEMPASVSNPLANQSTALIQQQLLLQMQLWRQLLARSDGSQLSNTFQDIHGNENGMQESNNPPSTSTQFLFTCGICCNFSCNDLESLCTHVRASRYPRTPLEESEWVNKSVSEGYLCRLCNYTTQLKTNFSLHCKTEKHTSKLQLVNHIREGGEANEWKVRHAIAGNNMSKVTCNGCRHSATSIDKLRIHCSTDRHQGTLTMCHYLDTMLKEAELGKDLHAANETSRHHHLLCRPCSYQSKFVVEMIQHMQCQNHQINVHQKQQSGGGSFADILCTEPDENDAKDDDPQSEKNEENQQHICESSEAEDKSVIDQNNDSVEIHTCRFCNYETADESILQVHLLTRHNAQSAIKCPMCSEFLDDVAKLQNHLIQIHRLTGEPGEQESDQDRQREDGKTESGERTILSGTLEAIEVPRELKEEKVYDVMETTATGFSNLEENLEKNVDNTNVSFPRQCKQCGDTLTTTEKWKLHLKLHEIQGGSETASLSEPASENRDEEPRYQLLRICSDPDLLRNALQNHDLDKTLEKLEPPYSCSPCEETFVSKNDLMTHLMTSLSHKCRGNFENTSIENVNAENGQNHDNDVTIKANVISDEPNTSTCGADEGLQKDKESEGKNGAESSNFDFSFLSEYKWKRGRLLYPGISKIAHKKVLFNVGQDEVSHFVENRSSYNREKALNWKQQNASDNRGQENNKNIENTVKDSINNDKKLLCSNGENSVNSHHQNTETPPTLEARPSSPYSCERCGKGFSNTWILKVHQKSVHNMDMSTEMLKEFVNKYSSWYWECARKEMEETTNSVTHSDTNMKFQINDQSRKVKEPTDLSNQTKTDENNNFQQAAIQTLLKNYPGLSGSFGGASVPSMPSQSQQTAEEDQSKFQQQMLLQMMITAQAQALHQQQANANSQDSNQPNASNIMNMLVDHLYGAALHGATPGFVDPVGIMSLLQQQNRMPAPGMSPYQWLAMRFMQQQQMQQLLMYPALAGATSGMSFMPSLSENTNQQQMLASFAASLLSPGITPDASQGIMNNPMAAALQAYQLQANNAPTPSSLSESRSNLIEQDQDIVKATKVPQRDSTPSVSQTLQAAELPAKRPRTRITDDQLKVLRANFDINTSPSENQISEMAEKTGLPSKVIKHWFRNTLFKERQRSKDSPYNFNIPPLTSLDDVKRDVPENDLSTPEESYHKVKVEMQPEEPGQNLTNAMENSSDVFSKFQNDNYSVANNEINEAEASKMSMHPSMAERQAMEILRSLSAGKSTSDSVKQSLLAMSFVPTPPHASNSGINEMSLNHASDVGRRITTENDTDNLSFIRESQNDSFGYERGLNSSSEFGFPNGHGGVTIGRRTPRTRFSDYQLKVLQEFFDKNAYPKDEDLDRLSRMLELSTRVIVVWFQNARQKARKSYEMQHCSMSSNPHSVSATSLTRYPAKRPSPPTSPLQRFSPNHVSNHTSGNIPQYLLESVQKYSNDNVAFSPKSGDVTRERSTSSQEDTSYRCRQCGGTLKTGEDLRQHEAMHAAQTSSYMNSVLQKCKMLYPSVYNDMAQGSWKDSQEPREESRRRLSQTSHPIVKEEKRLSYSKEDEIGELTSLSKPDESRSLNDVTFSLSQIRNKNKEKLYSQESKNSDAEGNSAIVQSLMSGSQSFNGQRDNMYITKRKMSISPTLSMTSSSSTSPNSTRKNISRNVITDTSKDPKRLRTTITPEQLEFLYKQYLVDSSPSRKVIEQISDIVGLKKRVVQVWFQNTRARERKGQFRSVGRITSVLGVPQPCPHCRVPFRTKADLDAHVRYRHMQSPSSVLPTLPQTSPMTSFSDKKMSPCSRSPNEIILSSSSLHGMTSVSNAPKHTSHVDKLQDYKEIFTNLSKQLKEKQLFQENSQNPSSLSNSMIGLESTMSAALSSKSIPFGSDEHPSSPKRRRVSDEIENTKPFVAHSAIPQTTFSCSNNISEHIYGSKPSYVDALAQKLQTKSSHSTRNDSNQHQAVERYPQPLHQSSTSAPTTVQSTMEKYFADKRATLSPPVSSPESLPPSSTSPPFMVPLKRHRTQMTSLQVRSLKHCFSECRTPTLLMCETLGEQIGLLKRVIQVWFQNARAKDKRAKQDDVEIDQSESSMQPGGSCRLCPDMRFGSLQDYRNHVFSKKHLQRFVNSYEGDGSDDQSRSSGKRTPSSDVEDVHTPPTTSVIERNPQQYFTSITSHDVAGNSNQSSESTVNTSSGHGSTQLRNPIAGWDASILSNPDLLQKYQQFAAVQKLMSAGSVSNGVDKDQNIDSSAVQHGNNVLSAFKQSWLQQTLLNSRKSGNSESSPFESIHTHALGEIRDVD